MMPINPRPRSLTPQAQALLDAPASPPAGAPGFPDFPPPQGIDVSSPSVAGASALQVPTTGGHAAAPTAPPPLTVTPAELWLPHAQPIPLATGQGDARALASALATQDVAPEARAAACELLAERLHTAAN
ncbi:MAG TPA: hypothetical protein VFH51_05890, partial [Myxococcota bacterium]|nr:hypothetical protein [Myxococcota bacterium]